MSTQNPKPKKKATPKPQTIELGYPIMKDMEPVKPLGSFIAIDPDSKGGMCLSVVNGGMKVKGLEGLFAKEIMKDLHHWIQAFNVQCIVIERQWARPMEGVSSSFKSGRQYGVVVAVAALQKIPIYFVNPTTWTKGLPSDKSERVELVNNDPRFVGAKLRQKDHGLADAFLFAKWIRYAGDKGT